MGRSGIMRAFLQRHTSPNMTIAPQKLLPAQFNRVSPSRTTSSQECRKIQPATLDVLGMTYNTDITTNLTPTITKKLQHRLHNQFQHPINLIRERIQDFFYKEFVNRVGNPRFAVFDNLSPVVSLQQNFDNLLVAADHPSRDLKDSYYINSQRMLRAHMTCHTCDIIRAGLDTFLTVGDVYRRDTIDSTHYPVFHQLDGVHLFNEIELFQNVESTLALFENVERTPEKQELHTVDTAQVLSHDLRKTLVSLALKIFGKDIEYRWVEAFFPFTHPSWELEIKYQGEWLEVLGCGILEQKILQNCGAQNKVGWAFGLGLERLAMKLYSIPDVRLFWSTDPGFLAQFKVDNPHTAVTYKDVSRYPSITRDVSFWINDGYSSNDFYDLARTIGADLVEQIQCVDQYTNKNLGKTSHAYRITYRHMHRNLTNDEVNVIQDKLREAVTVDLGCDVRGK